MTRTAFIAIVGRPNVGKSTLMNRLLGEKVAIVSSKPQTTRNRIAGILTKGEDQYVFIDTPGVHHAKTKLGEYMMKSVRSSVGSADAVILIADAGHPAGEIEKNLIGQIKKSELPSMLVLNKVDLINREKLAETITEYAALHNFDAVVPTCAENGRNVDAVLEEAAQFLYESDWMFDEDSLTDQPERQIAAEIIREKLLRALDEEIPHGTAVTIEEWTEKKGVVSIRAEIYCEKASHKGIIIGKHAECIKLIGTKARADIEKMLDTRVFLDLYVRVKENWRDSDFNINNFGYREDM
jgi:GTP-binding protein Era